MTTLSAFLITRNEARDIGDCLASLSGWTDEIVVVDDRSTDDTKAICERAGAKVFERALDGFGAQKQFALDQTTGEWAFSIDADERVTPELAQEIRRVIDHPQAGAFEVCRRFYFLGRRLNHGGVGRDWVLRLFRKTAGRFQGSRVHERVIVDGKVERLSGELLHYSYDSIEEYVEKANRYTTLAAEDLFAKGRRFHVTDNGRPFWELFSRIALKGAWRDGGAGLIYAALSAHTAWLRSIKLWALEHKKGSG